MKNWQLVGVLAGVVAGCGGGDPIAKADYPAKVAAALCAKIYDCCTAAEIADDYDSDSEADCNTKLQQQLSSDSKLTNPNVEYDADQAGKCIDGYKDLSCTDIANEDGGDTEAACDAIFKGRLADAAACERDYECASDFCDTSGSDGVCARLPGDGDECPDFECAAGLVCTGGTCAPPLANGATCESDFDCDSNFCNDQMQCAAATTSPTTTCDGN